MGEWEDRLSAGGPAWKTMCTMVTEWGHDGEQADPLPGVHRQQVEMPGGQRGSGSGAQGRPGVEI